MKDKDKQILEHMIRYCEEIRLAQERFGKDRETFYNDFVYYNSCCMSLMQMGELANRLSEEFKEANKAIPWKQIRGIRNIFAHEYAMADKGVVYDTLVENVPELALMLKAILERNSM